jgi:hypothetical protein
MSDTFAELRAAGVCVLRACGLVGRARASHYRHVRSPMHGPRSARVVPDNGQALSAAETRGGARVDQQPGLCGPIDRPDLGQRAGRGLPLVFGIVDVLDRPGRPDSPGNGDGKPPIRRR